MHGADRRRVLASFLAQPLEGEAADRLEEAVEPDTRSARIGDVAPHEALNRRARRLTEHVAAPFDDGLGLLEVEAALEDRQVVESALRGRRRAGRGSRRRRRLERPLSPGHVRGPGRAAADARPAGRGRPPGGIMPDPGGRQLDAERQPSIEQGTTSSIDGHVRTAAPSRADGLARSTKSRTPTRRRAGRSGDLLLARRRGAGRGS